MNIIMILYSYIHLYNIRIFYKFQANLLAYMTCINNFCNLICNYLSPWMFAGYLDRMCGYLKIVPKRPRILHGHPRDIAISARWDITLSGLKILHRISWCPDYDNPRISYGYLIRILKYKIKFDWSVLNESIL